MKSAAANDIYAHKNWTIRANDICMAYHRPVHSGNQHIFEHMSFRSLSAASQCWRRRTRANIYSASEQYTGYTALYKWCTFIHSFIQDKGREAIKCLARVGLVIDFNRLLPIKSLQGFHDGHWLLWPRALVPEVITANGGHEIPAMTQWGVLKYILSWFNLIK